MKSLVKYGMDESDLKKKWITFKMIEKAIIDQRVQNLIIDTLKVSKKNKNIASFGYKQIDGIVY